MNPNANVPENDPERDREKRPWMHERVFGGRIIKRKNGFAYNYDVVVCCVPDAIVDCLGDIIPRLSSKWGYGTYYEMRRHFYDGHGSKLSFIIHQLIARFFGCEIWAVLIGGISDAIKHLVG